MNLKDFSKSLKQAEKNLKKTTYSAEEILTDEFFIKNTKFSSLSDFLNSGNFPLDFDKIDGLSINQFILDNTKFNSWNNMLEEALAFKLLKPLL